MSVVITDGHVDTQRKKLKAAKIDNLIKNIVITYEVEYGIRKPDVKVIGYYCNKFGIKASESVYVGDHPVKDIIGMKDCGLKTIWLSNNRTWMYEDIIPDWIINEVFEVFLVVSNYNKQYKKD